MKTVLITGGTRGVGAELVKQYLARGFKVIATGSSVESVNRARNERSDVEWCVCNLSSETSINQFCESLDEVALDIVIHNAGIQQLRNYFDGSLEKAETVISSQEETMVNLTAPIIMTEKLMNNVLRAKGTCVYVTSGLAIAPKQSSPVYCANKAGLRGYTKSLRAQVKLSQQPIKICEAILPLVDTDMTRGRGKGKISAEDAAKQIISGTDKAKPEIQVGMTKVLMNVRKLFPNLAESMMLKA